MRVTDIYVSYLKIVRTFQIIRILIKHGSRELINRSMLGRHIRKRRIRKHKPVYTTQERLRITIEDLGPTYVKFGQILADRPDILSERFRKELKKLQTNALPFDDNLAIRLIEDELGAEIKDVFMEFNPHCISSASIGQVYTGRLKDGKHVVVKIRRPNIDQTIKLDLYLMHYLAARFAKEYPELAAINIVDVVDEFGESILKELNYYNESTNIIRFQDIFKNNPHVYIPQVYTQYTTHKMLVMERLYGLTPDDPVQLTAAGLDTKQIALNGAEALLIMIFKEGFFHADPHAGNMFILPENRIGLIDFGMVGALRPREMDFLANISIGFARRDPIGLADAMIHLCDVRFFEKRDDLIFALQQMLKRYDHTPVEKMDYARMIQDCIELISKFQLCIPSGIFMLAKALATIQKTAEKLDPDIPFAKLIIPYAREVVITQFSPRKLASELFQTLKGYATLIKTAPLDISEILYKFKQGQIKHEIQVMDMGDIKKLLRNVTSRLAYSILLVGLFIGSIILLAQRPDLEYGGFLLFMSSFLIFVVMLRWIFRKKKLD